MNFQEALRIFIRHLKTEKLRSGETVRAYRSDLEDFHRYLQRSVGLERAGEVTLVDAFHIRGFIAGRFGKVKKETLGRKLTAIRTFFGFLVREGVVPCNPAAQVKAPKRDQPLPRAMSVDEVHRFFSRNEDMPLRDRAMFELLYSSGLRVGELTSLKVEDVDLTNGWVRVMGKGRKERYAPVGSKALDAVRSYLPVRAALETQTLGIKSLGALFLNHRGAPLSSRSVRRILKRYLDVAVLARDVSPHAFRHSFATHMLHGGADLRSIQELLGHAGLSTTQRYTKADLGRLMTVYDRSHPRSGVTSKGSDKNRRVDDPEG